ncbi:hypothetical protein BK133_07100 [Paenibacillus sp. FSL H8-0548]|uniref:hypothetical protein n=1 Tax=Paenibacillus sp. FSL H8-0548 TaxID=1920422 RepID=UPI00096D575D|nr:hypothetical protein [Paenibacillus sp. FSL H8-0548]OMF36977.1 hypothetical protein BK133_07100 [Paenibacillus sp. FSL H8-0548]
MKLEDALFNWLQIKVVSDARQEDQSALDTLAFFEQILSEDHGLTDYSIIKIDDTMIHVKYVKESRSKLQLYPRELGEQLLTDIESNPKYN